MEIPTIPLLQSKITKMKNQLQQLLDIANEGSPQATRPNWWWKEKINEMIIENTREA